MGVSLIIDVPNSRDAISSASAEADAWLQLHQASLKITNLVLLAIEELLVNCINYGYDDSNEHTIVIDLSIDELNLKMTVIDDGHPFDPLKTPAPDFSLQIQQRPVGGLGIHLLRQLSDHVAYERRDGANRFTLTKRLT